MFPFTPGIKLVRKDIHKRFGGQMQGGMATPKNHPVILLFTGKSGEKYGYFDKPLPDGLYSFTGEGMRGDMEYIRANKALREHLQDGKRVFLFENVGNGFVKLFSEVRYLSSDFEERLDIDENPRKAIVFKLEPIGVRAELEEKSEQTVDLEEPNPGDSLEELRRKALVPPPRGLSSSTRIKSAYFRSRAVKLYALKREAGKCPGCDKPGPFKTKRGLFLEVHHLDRLADGGPDLPDRVVAVCPNCHREVHLGTQKLKLDTKLRDYVVRKERDLRQGED